MCVCVRACVRTCVRSCMCCDRVFLLVWLNSQWHPVTIAKHGALLTLLQLYNGDLAIPGKYVDTKRCISHIMWHVQPSFELIILSLTIFLRCALLGKHDCVTRLLQAFVNTCVCVYWCTAGKVPGSILLICSHC